MTTDVHTLSGAYALNALDPSEAAEFEQHLAACAACRDEVAELQQAAALMGAAEQSAAPASLRARVLDAVDRTPQVPPTVAGGPTSPESSPGTVTPLRSRPVRRFLVAAAAVAAVVVGGVVVTDAMRDDDPGSVLSAGVTEVLRASDAQAATVDTTNGGKVTVAMSGSAGRMAVDTSGLPDLDAERVYQLWTVREGVMASAAVLEDHRTGASMDLPEEGFQVAITVEPAGGSEQPTSDPVVVVDPADL